MLSNGHACALLYSVLHLSGYHFTLDDLKAFRTVGSKTPGHPEAGPHPENDGIEVTTGPLGQGLSSAVGLAIGERNLAANFNQPGFDVIDNYTYVFCGDGCLQEGITSEASSLAGHLGLGKLIVLYDSNSITIDGETELSFTEDVRQRYTSYGWQVLEVPQGNEDLAGIAHAIEVARKEVHKPSLIIVTTTIGFGAAKQGTEAVHGSPLGNDDLANVKKLFGFDPAAKFAVPKEAYAAFDAKKKGAEAFSAWETLFAAYAKAHPDKAAELDRRIKGELPKDWKEKLPKYAADGKAEATRVSSGLVLNAISEKMHEIIGGSADLNPSTMTYLKQGGGDFQKATPAGRNIRFGVREHAMCAISNGLALYGAFIPFGSTFLNFIGYALGAVTLSAITHLRVLYIFTHDSIGLGEDGPTHQPVEKFAVCRATPNMLFLRPADGNETVGAYIQAIEHKHTPTVMALSRQALPQLAGSSPEKVAFGAYVLQGAEKARLILVGTGSEVSLCVQARDELVKAGVATSVVSMPSWELFEKQSAEYKASVFPEGTPVLSVEAGTVFGWDRYAHYSIGIPAFGASGPAPKVYEHVGVTAKHVVAAGTKLANHFNGNAPSKVKLF